MYARKPHKEKDKQKKKTRIVKNGFLLGALAGTAAAVGLVIAAPVVLGTLAIIGVSAGLAATGVVGGGVIGMYIAG